MRPLYVVAAIAVMADIHHDPWPWRLFEAFLAWWLVRCALREP